MNYKTRLFSSITDIDREAWNRLVAPDRLICSYDYLLAIEKTHINDCSYAYPVIYNSDNEIIAHACIYYITTDLVILAKGLLQRIVSRIRSRFPSFLMLKTIECGTPIALGSTISVSQAIQVDEALNCIVEKMCQKAKTHRAHVLLIRDFYEHNKASCQSLLKKGFSVVNNLPSAVLPIRWKTFDAYLASMKSHYRYKVKRIRAKAEKHGVTFMVKEDFSQDVDIMADLWMNAYQNAHEYRREILHADFFKHINEELGVRSQALFAVKDNAVIGFLLLLLDDHTLIPLFCGLDYTFNRECGVYLSLFLKTIELAIQRGMEVVDFGITSLSPKLELGSNIMPLYMYMKHLNQWLNRIVPFLFNLSSPPISEEKRAVFITHE